MFSEGLSRKKNTGKDKGENVDTSPEDVRDLKGSGVRRDTHRCPARRSLTETGVGGTKGPKELYGFETPDVQKPSLTRHKWSWT